MTWLIQPTWIKFHHPHSWKLFIFMPQQSLWHMSLSLYNLIKYYQYRHINMHNYLTISQHLALLLPLLTPIWSGVCLLLFLALRSAPPVCSCSITLDSSPNAAWCMALSPSLSSNSRSQPLRTNTRTTWNTRQERNKINNSLHFLHAYFFLSLASMWSSPI